MGDGKCNVDNSVLCSRVAIIIAALERATQNYRHCIFDISIIIELWSAKYFERKALQILFQTVNE
jgi:hypothetical protein